MRPGRVRHHTNDFGLQGIRGKNAIDTSRGWGNIAVGVHVEVEPFGTTRPSTPARPGPKGDFGCEGEGAYVEFDAPPGIVCYSCGQRNSGFIPVSEPLSLVGLNPRFVKVRCHWYEFWRQRPE
jgi:hypothetical protein